MITQSGSLQTCEESFSARNNLKLKTRNLKMTHFLTPSLRKESWTNFLKPLQINTNVTFVVWISESLEKNSDRSVLTDSHLEWCLKKREVISRQGVDKMSWSNSTIQKKAHKSTFHFTKTHRFLAKIFQNKQVSKTRNLPIPTAKLQVIFSVRVKMHALRI